jgi:hypothetical protein
LRRAYENENGHDFRVSRAEAAILFQKKGALMRETLLGLTVDPSD